MKNLHLPIKQIKFSPKLVWYNYKIKLKFRGSCLKEEEKAAFTPKVWSNFLLHINESHGHEI